MKLVVKSPVWDDLREIGQRIAKWTERTKATSRFDRTVGPRRPRRTLLPDYQPKPFVFVLIRARYMSAVM